MGPVNKTKSLRELAGSAAAWRQPSPLRQEYDLTTAAGEVVATLRWRKNWGTVAVARAPEGSWTYKANGFLSPKVTVRLPNSEHDFATFRPGADGEGTLEGLAEVRFNWRCINFWTNAWAFYDAEGDRLMQVHPEIVQSRAVGVVQFDAKASQWQEIGYLASLGWYLLVLMAADHTVPQA